MVSEEENRTAQALLLAAVAVSADSATPESKRSYATHDGENPMR